MLTVHLIHVQNNLQLDELMNELQSLQLKKGKYTQTSSMNVELTNPASHQKLHNGQHLS
jgi:hypothetical protein